MINIINGSLIQLENSNKTLKNVFIIELIQKDEKSHVCKVLLAALRNPYQRLHIRNSELEYKEVSRPNKDSLFHIEEDEDGSYRLFTYSDTSQTRNYLVWSSSGLAVCSVERQDDTAVHTQRASMQHTISIVDHAALSSSSLLPPPTIPRTLVSNPVTKKQVRDLVMHGYLILPGIVSQTTISRCSRFLLHHVGQVGCLIPGAVQGEGFGKFPGSMSQHKEVKDLFSNEVIAIVEDLLGGKLEHMKNLNTQIALRFPELPTSGEECRHGSMIEWHVDGYRQGISHSFSLLVGVCLSDVDQDFSGNLCVWPGSHFLLHRCKVGPHGDFDVDRISQFVESVEVYANLKSGSAARSSSQSTPSRCAKLSSAWDLPYCLMFLEAASQTAEVLGKRPDLPCLGCPEQLKLKAGDVVILHPDLAHGGAPNYSASIRQMVYFRVRLSSDVSWSELSDNHVNDMWCDLQGVKNMLGKELQLLQDVYYYNCV